MGDFGADVIKIEPPGGECTRTVGPFYEDMPNRERSLYFWHYNTSKRGITLDLETEDGRQLFRKLAEGADVILETFKPGYLPSLGLGYDDLKESNPRPDHVLPDLLWSDRAVEELPREAICCTLRRAARWRAADTRRSTCRTLRRLQAGEGRRGTWGATSPTSARLQR